MGSLGKLSHSKQGHCTFYRTRGTLQLPGHNPVYVTPRSSVSIYSFGTPSHLRSASVAFSSGSHTEAVHFSRVVRSGLGTQLCVAWQSLP